MTARQSLAFEELFAISSVKISYSLDSFLCTTTQRGAFKTLVLSITTLLPNHLVENLNAHALNPVIFDNFQGNNSFFQLQR